jgi:hypothetical protein
MILNIGVLLYFGLRQAAFMLLRDGRELATLTGMCLGTITSDF